MPCPYNYSWFYHPHKSGVSSTLYCVGDEIVKTLNKIALYLSTSAGCCRSMKGSGKPWSPGSVCTRKRTAVLRMCSTLPAPCNSVNTAGLIKRIARLR
jgi:hypothetical protein